MGAINKWTNGRHVWHAQDTHFENVVLPNETLSASCWRTCCCCCCCRVSHNTTSLNKESSRCCFYSWTNSNETEQNRTTGFSIVRPCCSRSLISGLYVRYVDLVFCQVSLSKEPLKLSDVRKRKEDDRNGRGRWPFCFVDFPLSLASFLFQFDSITAMRYDLISISRWVYSKFRHLWRLFGQSLDNVSIERNRSISVTKTSSRLFSRMKHTITHHDHDHDHDRLSRQPFSISFGRKTAIYEMWRQLKESQKKEKQKTK